MKLMTAEIAARIPALYATDGVPADEKVVQVKFFDPTGAATWLIVEASAVLADGSEVALSDPKAADAVDVSMFGHCDLGMGCPEWGYVSLNELKSVKGRLGLGIERDRHLGTPTFGSIR